jgi:hypothetical protein
MPNDAYVKGKSKEQILIELHGTANPGSVTHEQQKAAILVRCTQDLESRANELTTAIGRAAGSLDRRGQELGAAITEAARTLAQSTEAAGRSSDRLASMLVVLNVLLAAGTIVGAVATVASLFK